MFSNYVALVGTTLFLTITAPAIGTGPSARVAAKSVAFASGATGGTAVTFVLVDRLARDDIEAEVIQRGGPGARTLVLVRRGDLSTSLLVLVEHVLATAERRRPAAAVSGERRLFIHKGARTPRGGKVDDSNQRDLVRQIETAQNRNVEGIGDYPALTIVLSLP